MIVYIAAPFTKGDVGHNVNTAIQCAEALVNYGFTPYIPHLNILWHIAAPHTPDFWYHYDLEFLVMCDCLLRLKGESQGADNEVAFANQNGVKVYYSIGDLINVYGV